MPLGNASGNTVTLNTTTSTAFLPVGGLVQVEFWGWLTVTARPTSTSVTLSNPANTTTGAYVTNAAAGTTLAAGAVIALSGPQGVAGTTDATLFLAKASNLSDLADATTARTNLALGTVATFAQGNTNGSIPKVDDAANLTAGEIVFATAAGIESQDAATARTTLGIGTMGVQAASAVAITGGSINSTPVGNSTPSTVAATTLAATGSTTLGARLFTPPTTIQSLLAATVLVANAAKIKVVGNGGAVTLTATPTITLPAADGQLVLIQGTNDTNTVTLQDEGTLTGSKLQLGSTSRVLGNGDNLLLTWDATDGFWYEVAFSAL